MAIVLILGSGPGVVACRPWPRAPFDQIVAINNAWAVRPDWDWLIHSEDFPPERLPPEQTPQQKTVTAEDFVPAQNARGGFVYAGGTMAFTAGYWALHALRPTVLAFLGCDMVYDGGPQSHFYGKGTADPLRKDVTLRSLEGKSARLMIHAARAGCAAVNLGAGPSRMVLPRATPDSLHMVKPAPFDQMTTLRAEAAEAMLGYHVPSGRYWEVADRFDADRIDVLDSLWLKAARQPQTAS
jgi:hypothetical protein